MAARSCTWGCAVVLPLIYLIVHDYHPKPASWVAVSRLDDLHIGKKRQDGFVIERKNPLRYSTF
ncbi:hypothetical protein DL95DRAFT_156182 [Leptodontidium sp. 2 PMI_412]|nr:hypothetical protein DL95DRAFT_156182 [Leptodontidium sp. 2 PMI_412]